MENLYKRFRPGPEAGLQHHGFSNELLQLTHQVSPAFSYSPHLRARLAVTTTWHWPERA